MKYRRYAAYKESGVEWLGEVPAHWGTTRLKHLCTASALYGANESAESYSTTGVRFLRTTDIDDFGRLTPEEDGVFLERQLVTDYLLNDGDILISRSGTLGRSFVYNPVIHGECAYAGYLVRFVPKEQSCSRFVFYFTKTKPFIDWLAFSTISSTIGNVNGQKYANMPIPFPPLAEMVAIVSFLDRETAQIGALIARQERLLAVLQEKRQALISHAVTKGLNPQAAMKESGVEWLGEVPSHWEVKRLKHIAHVQTGVAKGRDLAGQPTMQVPYLRVANVQDGYLDLTDVATIEIAVSELERYRLQPGDVLMNEGGDNDKLGRGHVWRGEVEVCIHQNHVFAVRPHGVDPEWLSLVTGADYAKFYFYSFAKQSTNLASISSSNLRELPILCPPAAERDVIRSYIAVETALIDQLMQKAEAAVARLQERRAALISAAVTGKIDVRGLTQKVDHLFDTTRRLC